MKQYNVNNEMVAVLVSSRRIVRHLRRKKRVCMEAMHNTRAVVQCRAAAKRVLVPIANGSEEMEAVIVSDVLRRAECEVVIASVEAERSICALRRVTLVADTLIGDVCKEDFDAIVLPGGMPGAEKLRDCNTLKEMLQAAAKDESTVIAAICAAPAVVLQPLGLLDGIKTKTCHPAFASCIENCQDIAVADDEVITSRGPGTAFAFSLALVRRLMGNEVAEEVAAPMCLQYPVVVS